MRRAVRRAATVVAAPVVAVLVLCASLGWVAVVPAAAGAPPDTPSSAVPGIEQVFATSQGTWAVLAMGHLESRTNTFWQVLFRATGAAGWSLVTPPGVASNGGFSIDGTAGPSGAVVAGFQPSKYLLYSPIAETVDQGKHWSAGTLGSALVFAADAVASEPGGSEFALVRGGAGGGTLLRSDGSITRWSTVTTVRGLASSSAGRACKVEALSAVVVATGAPEVGTDCATAGTAGIFRETHGTWVSTGPSLSGTRSQRSQRSQRFDVVRLWNDASGTTALIEGRGAGKPSLVVAWRTSLRSTWSVSAPVSFSGDVLSTATGTGSGVAVVTGSDWDARAVETIAGPGQDWRTDGRPPAGTQAVAFTVGDLVALSVHDSDVAVWQGGAAGGWQETSQQVRVPIEYGSST